MAILISFEGELPKRVENLVIYPTRYGIIIREKSGFTTEELATSEKYANCRKNASEFGRISSSCKGLRILLAELLPKENNLAIVNTLNKKMRSILNHDTDSERGERLLSIAMQNPIAQQNMVGYAFNPSTTFKVTTEYAKDCLTLHLTEKPETVNWVGFRLHAINYDFTEKKGSLLSGEWHFEQQTNQPLKYPYPTLPIEMTGTILYLLEVQSFCQYNGSFLPEQNGSKALNVLECLYLEVGNKS